MAVPAETCPEQAEQPAAPSMQRTRGGPEQQHIRHSPERPAESIPQRGLRQQVRVLDRGIQPMGASGQCKLQFYDMKYGVFVMTRGSSGRQTDSVLPPPWRNATQP